MKKKYNLLWIAILITFSLGFEAGGFQLALIMMGREYGLTDSSLGGVVAAQYIATIIFPILMGSISDRFNKRNILMIFAGVFVLGTVIVIIPSSIFMFVGIFIIGAGFSICESLVAAVLAQEYTDKTERYQNLTQAFFSIGAMSSPLVNGILINRLGLNWRSVFLLCGALFIIIIMLLKTVTLKYKEKTEVKEGSCKWNNKSLIFLLLFVTIVICVALENGISFFAGLLLNDHFKNPQYASIALSLFWLGTIISRIISSWLSRHSKVIGVISFIGLAATITFITQITAEKVLMVYFLIGLFIGPIWPIIMSFATKEYPDNAGLVSGILMTGCGLGGAAMPLLMGLVSERYGIINSFALLSVVALLGMVIYVGYLVRSRS